MKCQNCGNTITDDSKFCGYCGFQVFPLNFEPVPVDDEGAIEQSSPAGKFSFNSLSAILTVVMVVLGCLCVFLGMRALQNSTAASVAEAEVARLNEELALKDDTISMLREVRTNYRRLLNGIMNIHNDYTYFMIDNPIVYVRKGNSTTVKLTTRLAADAHITYKVDNSSVSTLKYAKDSWYDSVDITVTGVKEGVAVYTFSNSVNDQQFKLVVVVDS